MRVLVDTHAFFWWAIDQPKLSSRARVLLADEANEIFVSAVVAWELATKARSGRWPEALPLATSVEFVIEEYEFIPLSVTIEHARTAGFLSGDHRDPFDRMLAAQSLVEGIPLITADRVFRGFGTSVMW